MRTTSLTWEMDGQYRGISIGSGSAYVGELVALLLSNCANKIKVETNDEPARDLFAPWRERVTELEAALNEIRAHALASTGSVTQGYLVAQVRKALGEADTAPSEGTGTP